MVSSGTTALAEFAADTFVVDPTDEQSMADGIAKAWSSPERPRPWRDDPRSAEFRWDGIVERLLETYAEAGGPPPRAAGDGA